MEFVNRMPNLKYLDISNFEAIDSSAEFASLPCLEYVHLGNKYKFERASLDGGEDFIKLEDHKVYSTREISIPSNVEIGTIGGHYVRPSCTKEASFNNKYIKPNITKEASKEEKKNDNIAENPKTGNTYIVIIIITIIMITIMITSKKRIMNRIK